MTMMRDISVARNAAAMGTTVDPERVYNKVQDFVYDDVLFEYCRFRPVRAQHVCCGTLLLRLL